MVIANPSRGGAANGTNLSISPLYNLHAPSTFPRMHFSELQCPSTSSGNTHCSPNEPACDASLPSEPKAGRSTMSVRREQQETGIQECLVVGVREAELASGASSQ